MALIEHTFNHFHICGGSGSGAAGFNDASDGSCRLGNMVARFRCIGSVDVDPAGCHDFEQMTGTPQMRLDLFDELQYRAFHGHAPPAGWTEAVPDDLRRAAGYRHPHIAFMSCPCKGFSGLLSEMASKLPKYQALNGLTLRAVWLLLETHKNDPVELILFENVPRIATRGRFFLDQIVGLLRAYGYAVQETEHDCGELGELGQSRKRFLLVARYVPKVPNFLYEPPKGRLRSVGEVLDRLPMPLTGFGGPLHRMPELQWQTWLRLALVEAGSDWRSLNKLAVEDGYLKDIGIVPDYGVGGSFGVTPWDGIGATVKGRSLPTNGEHAVADPRFDGQPRRATFGVNRWDESSGVIGGESFPSNGAYAVADVRVKGHPKSVQLGVRPWDRPAGVITGKMIAGGGPNSVADPRLTGGPRFNNTFRIVRYDETSPAVAGPGGPAGGLAVADPRAQSGYGGKGKYQVTGYGDAAGTVIAASTTGHGAFALADPRYGNWHPGASSSKVRVTDWDESARPVTGSTQVASGAGAIADPRPEFARAGRDKYLTGGHYGVVRYDQTGYAVTGAGQHDNGFNSVADPRIAFEGAENYSELPAPRAKVVCIIRALDGTWHRPFTTLECAALQSMFDPEKYFTSPEDYWDLHGMSDSAKRERIGNAVPRASAKGMAGAFGRCLLAALNGETFTLSSDPIWVQPVTLALAAARLPEPLP